MTKVYHPQVASVMQSALGEFRHVSRMTVSEMCEAGAALSPASFYCVQNGKIAGRVPYSCLAYFYSRHLPGAKADAFLVEYAKAWIKEDLFL